MENKKKLEKIEDILIKSLLKNTLTDCYVCTRVWSAWSYNTMSKDDFIPIQEDEDLLEEMLFDFKNHIKSKENKITLENIDDYYNNFQYEIYYNSDIDNYFESYYFKNDYLSYVDLDLFKILLEDDKLNEKELSSYYSMYKSEKQKDALNTNNSLKGLGLSVDFLKGKINLENFEKEYYKNEYNKNFLESVKNVVFFVKNKDIKLIKNINKKNKII